MAELSINDKLFKPKAVLGEISRAKDSMISPADYRMTVGDDFRKQEMCIRDRNGSSFSVFSC